MALLDSRPIKAQVISGLQMTGWILLYFFTAMGLMLGIMILPGGLTLKPGTPWSTHPWMSWLYFAVAFVIAVRTVDRWAKTLSGLIGYGVFGGLLMLSSGHHSNSTVRVSRPETAAVLALWVVIILFLRPFQKRRLYLSDRIAALSFTFVFLFCMLVGPPTRNNTAHLSRLQWEAQAGALLILVVCWLFDRIQRHYNRRPSGDYVL